MIVRFHDAATRSPWPPQQQRRVPHRGGFASKAAAAPIVSLPARGLLPGQNCAQAQAPTAAIRRQFRSIRRRQQDREREAAAADTLAAGMQGSVSRAPSRNATRVAMCSRGATKIHS